MYRILKKIISYFLIGLNCSLFFFPSIVLATSVPSSVSVSVYYCGNDTVDPGEVCDGSDLNGQSCSTLGYVDGTLTCQINCQFNTTGCNTSSGGGGGGGGGITVYVPKTSVNFSGKAYPGSQIYLLKDGQIALSTPASPDANFNIELSGLSAGNYVFSIYAEDYKGVRSKTTSFQISVTSGASTQVSGIFIAPTINLNKKTIKQGDNLSIFGQAFPQSAVTIAINSDEEHFAKINANEQGAYLYNFDTSVLALGEHHTKAKSAIGNALSNYGEILKFTVNNTGKEQTNYQKGDLSNDGKVNLIDFSILAYWYNRKISGDFKVKEKNNLNNSGNVDLVDFSILAYYWTG